MVRCCVINDTHCDSFVQCELQLERVLIVRCLKAINLPFHTKQHISSCAIKPRLRCAQIYIIRPLLRALFIHQSGRRVTSVRVVSQPHGRAAGHRQKGAPGYCLTSRQSCPTSSSSPSCLQTPPTRLREFQVQLCSSSPLPRHELGSCRGWGSTTFGGDMVSLVKGCRSFRSAAGRATPWRLGGFEGKASV